MASEDGGNVPLSVAAGGVAAESGNETSSCLINNDKDLNVPGIVSIAVFYLAVLVVGLWAGWRQRRKRDEDQSGADQEEVMLAGRNIGLFVGVLTMGATWVGGQCPSYTYVVN